MRHYLLLPLLFLVFACSSDEMDGDEIGNTVDPFIGIWTHVNLDGYTAELNVRNNGTFTSGFPYDDIDEGGNGSWINTATEPNFTNRTQTYLSNFLRVYDEPENITILFGSDFNSFMVEGGEFVRK